MTQSAELATDDLTVVAPERIVRDVRACVEANISVAGLALALTLPDVLGQQCYPDLVYPDGDRKIRAQYVRWYDSYVARRFGGRDGWFDGDRCYELRCALLHSGRADIDYHHHGEREGRDSYAGGDGYDAFDDRRGSGGRSAPRYVYDFRLVDDGEQLHQEFAHPSRPGVRVCRVHLNADQLAAALADGAERCLAAQRR